VKILTLKICQKYKNVFLSEWHRHTRHMSKILTKDNKKLLLRLRGAFCSSERNYTANVVYKYTCQQSSLCISTFVCSFTTTGKFRDFWEWGGVIFWALTFCEIEVLSCTFLLINNPPFFCSGSPPGSVSAIR